MLRRASAIIAELLLLDLKSIEGGEKRSSNREKLQGLLLRPPTSFRASAAPSRRARPTSSAHEPRIEQRVARSRRAVGEESCIVQREHLVSRQVADDHLKQPQIAVELQRRGARSDQLGGGRGEKGAGEVAGRVRLEETAGQGEMGAAKGDGVVRRGGGVTGERSGAKRLGDACRIVRGQLKQFNRLI
jgi:hypothetical protein